MVVAILLYFHAAGHGYTDLNAYRLGAATARARRAAQNRCVPSPGSRLRIDRNTTLDEEYSSSLSLYLEKGYNRICERSFSRRKPNFFL